MSLTHDASLLQLVHQSACTVVADGELTLNEACGTTLFTNDEAGGILEHRVKVSQVDIVAASPCSSPLAQQEAQAARKAPDSLAGRQ